jgi:DNA-binding PadR family transcriptional regulator
MSAQTLKVVGILVSDLDHDMSGAEIARSTKLASGTLYPILMRLEDAGWVRSRWESEDPRELGRPRRRLYQMTGVGVQNARRAFKEIVLPFKEFAWQ